MPKELTHWMLANQAAAGLDSGNRLFELIRHHQKLYLAGAVLPDTLLHLFLPSHGPDGPALAHRFHDSRGNSYAPLIRIDEAYAAEGIPAGLLACLLGVLSHIQADIVFHPFVHALSGSGDRGRHYQVETAIDIHFSRLGSVFPAQRLDQLITPANVTELVTASTLLFDPAGSVPRQTFEQALKLHCRIQAMYDSAFWKLVASLLSRLPIRLFQDARQLFYPLILSGADTAELFGTWRHPVTGEEKTESPDALAEAVVQRTVALFERIGALGGLKEALSGPPGENMQTGIYGVKQQEMVKHPK